MLALKTMPVIVFLAGMVTVALIPAYAQYGSNSNLTPEKLQLCESLGISPNNCTDQNIVSKQGHQVAKTETASPPFDIGMVVLIIGLAIGVPSIVILVRSINRKHANQSMQK